ncbi:Nif3-like dinuclear metal center hexameric protein [Aridibaculum aurantiacum]|uniref:Nif3-like dinuclear metal center hexameric protein n=1 Tax=Aridibaculum aurantiacum TaxID=2810307 RepID=UPI001A970F58|nr:Nif3-like dinuclear metal center hexameric protein [Aridibaculum aurantiacum]
MPTIAAAIKVLEELAPPSYQESYDNCGLLVGYAAAECKGILCTLDATEDVIAEAIEKGCNLVVAHHPIIFGGLKKITGRNYVERTVIAAIKNDIAIYAIHTNLDNLLTGVNGKMADKLGLENRKVLLHRQNNLLKLAVFVPEADADKVREAIFKAGGGNIGKYSECSFNIKGTGTFKAGEGTNPHIGEIGKREEANEEKIEVILPVYKRDVVVEAMLEAHPYEEVAYDVVALTNYFQEVGSGLYGELPEPMVEKDFLNMVKEQFGLQALKHTPLMGKPVKTVALCGGAGSFLIKNALGAKADIYITSDIKYHEFFDAEGRMVIADIGHYESEQFTVDLLHDVLEANFPNFAVLKSGVRTNPVQYFM